MAIELAAIHLPRLQRRQLSIHGLQLGLQLRLQLGHRFLLLTGIGQHLLQALAQVTRLPGHTLLLLALLGQAGLQLTNLQLQCFAAGGSR